MSPQKTITINGRLYDAVTGLPVDEKSAPATVAAPAKSTPKPAAPAPTAAKPKVPRPAGTPRPDVIRTPVSKAAKPAATTKPAGAKPKPAAAAPRSTTAAGAVHSTLQRPKTLNRRIVKKPEAPNRPITRRKAPGRHMDIAKSASVSRFVAHPVTETVKPKPAASTTPDKPAQVHPLVHRAIQKTTPKKAPAAKKPATAKEVKEQAIAKALATAPTKKASARSKKALSKKQMHRLAIILASLAVLFAALFAAYKMMPSISVSIASAQAGISASYPEYTPDGYSLSQPVNYSDGEITLKFASHSNDNYYTITQTRSSWDSSAVLDNVVTPAVGDDYVTTKERGLTIYSFKSAAVWVNGGILYKIDSKAPLSGDQIRKIATSL